MHSANPHDSAHWPIPPRHLKRPIRGGKRLPNEPKTAFPRAEGGGIAGSDAAEPAGCGHPPPLVVFTPCACRACAARVTDSSLWRADSQPQEQTVAYQTPRRGLGAVRRRTMTWSRFTTSSRAGGRGATSSSSSSPLEGGRGDEDDLGTRTPTSSRLRTRTRRGRHRPLGTVSESCEVGRRGRRLCG